MQDSRDDKLEIKALTASITVLVTTALVFGGCMIEGDDSASDVRAAAPRALDSAGQRQDAASPFSSDAIYATDTGTGFEPARTRDDRAPV